MISIICPSPKGKDIAFRLQKSLNANLYIKDKKENIYDEYYKINTEIYVYSDDFRLSEVSRKAFENSDKIVFISSTGIAVRAIGNLIKSKDKDPGVVVVDLAGKYAISLLSGHLGGGNELAHEISRLLDCEPIITTATDNMNIAAPDILAKKYGLVIDDLKSAKYIASLLVDGKEVGIKDDYNTVDITKGYKSLDRLQEDSIWITDSLNYEDESLDPSKILKLIKKDIVLGIGCRRHTPYEKILTFVEEVMKKYNYDLRAVSKIVSVEVKKNEKGIIKLSEKINCSFQTFTREEIKKVQDKYEKSEFVFKTLGIYSVCEPSVDLGGADVIISKIKHEGMTLAIGKLR